MNKKNEFLTCCGSARSGGGAVTLLAACYSQNSSRKLSTFSFAFASRPTLHKFQLALFIAPGLLAKNSIGK